MDDLWAELAPRAHGAQVPATPTQLLWLNRLAESHPPRGERTMHFATRLTGELDVELLRECVRTLSQRHESLRSRIVRGRGGVILHIDDAGELAFDCVDLEAVPAAQLESEIALRCEAFITTKVDLSVGPLFAARLFRLSAVRHVLIVAAEHSVTDEISNAILHNELWTLYRQGEHGQPFSLPSLSLQFGDYAVWQQQTAAAWWNRHGPYWRSRLASAPRVRWPFAAGRLQEPEQARYPMLHIPLGSEVSDGLRRVAQRERTLLALVVLTVHAAALSRWLQQQDLVIRFVAHARYRPNLQGVVGFMANCLHLRVDVDPCNTLAQLLQRITTEMQSAYQHPDFDRVPTLLPESTGELTFNWVARGARRAAQGGGTESDGAVRVEPSALEIAWPRGRPYFARFADNAAGIGASVHYQPHHFARSEMDRFGESLRLFGAQFYERPLERIG